MDLDEVDRRIILALDREDEINVSKMIKKAGLPRQTAYSHLEKLVGLGLVSCRKGGFPRTRLLKLSQEGLKICDELKRVASAGQTEPAGWKAFQKLLRERCKTLKYMAPSLQESFSKAYAQYLTASATWGFYIPMAKDILEKIEGYAEALVEGADVAVYPPPQSVAEEEAIGKAALEFLAHLLRNKQFRKEVAEAGKLTFILSLDLRGINEPAEVKAQILFWALTYEGLHKEGKI